MGRPKRAKKFHGNRYTANIPTSSQSSIQTSQIRKTPKFKLHKRGYCKRFITPIPTKKYHIEFRNEDGLSKNKREAEKPTGMRIIDIGILGEAIEKLRCNTCSYPLRIFESDVTHGWQTTFSIKCKNCHLLHVDFPSSKPMNLPPQSSFVNIDHSIRTMNQVTMRSILAVHCSGFSCRDLHKFATIFDMPPPLAHMPPRYLNKIEGTVESAFQYSMHAAATELRVNVDAIPSAVPNCVNIFVSFDSSWKTRGFYSNLGFGSAISATSKKVLDYALLNRICEKCNRWNEQRQQREPEAYQRWYQSHKPNCFKNFSGSSQPMEPEAAKIIWNRSIEKHQLCYNTFIGDGGIPSHTNKLSTWTPIH